MPRGATNWQKILGNTSPPTVSGGPELDAFGRFRVSQPFTLLSATQIYDNLPLIYLESKSGTGGATHSVNLAETAMSVTAGGVGSVIRQTRQYYPYRAANSQLIMMTFVLGTCAAGVTKRVGYFDANNGLFLQQTSTGLSLVVRTYTSGQAADTPVAQSSWNLDTLDGSQSSSNPTGLTLDATKAHIFWFEFQWLGTGRITWGFDLEGEMVPVHTIDNANALTSVYMSTGSLPIRYELTNSDVGGGTYNAGTLKQICASVVREGAPDEPGYETSASRGGTSATAADGTLTTLLAIRLSSTHIRATLVPRALQILNAGAVPVRYCLSLNPTTTGSFASWTSTGTGLASEYSASVLPVTATGTVLETGYIAASASAGPSRSFVGAGGLSASLDVLASIAGVSDVLCLSAAGIGNTAACYAALRWAEVY